MRNHKIVQLSVKSMQKEGEIYAGKDLWKRNVLSVEWKSDGVMDGESCDDEDEVTWEKSRDKIYNICTYITLTHTRAIIYADTQIQSFSKVYVDSWRSATVSWKRL